MSAPNLQNLPPELQARLAAVMAGKQQAGAAQQPVAQPNAPTTNSSAYVPQGASNPPAEQPPAEPPKPPSLVDILSLLRNEIAYLRAEVAEVNKIERSNGQVIEAVGHAVGRMYQMFQPTEQPTSGSTYSQNFQQQAVNEDSDY